MTTARPAWVDRVPIADEGLRADPDDVEALRQLLGKVALLIEKMSPAAERAAVRNAARLQPMGERDAVKIER